MLKKKLFKYLFVLTFMLTACESEIAKVPETVKTNETKVTEKKVEENKSQLEKISNILIWEVSSKKAQSKSYLVGTVHTDFKADYKIPENIITAIKNAKTFMIEADVANLEDASNPELMKLTLQYVMDLSQNLKTSFTAEEWSTLVKKLEPFGANEATLGKMRPWYISSSLELPAEVAKDKNRVPMDVSLKKLADSNKIKADYFETVEQQFKIVSEALTSEEYIKNIKEQLKKTDSLQVFNQMIKKYNEKDIAFFEKEQNDNIKKEPKQYKAMVEDRNNAWITKIQEKLDKNESLFIAVGLLHVIGEKGLVKMLEKNGFEVKML